MDYKRKYEKYKNKYLNLRGGNNELSTETCDALLYLFKKYYTNMKNDQYKNQYVLDSIEHDIKTNFMFDSTLLKNIKLDYTIKEITANFEKYGILILRNPKSSDVLLLGCGNTPVDENYLTHHHNNMITINPEISMNPTIVGAVGYHIGINKYFSDNSIKYNNLIGEGVTLIMGTEVTKPVLEFLDIALTKDYGVFDDCPLNYYGRGLEAFKKSNFMWDGKF